MNKPDKCFFTDLPTKDGHNLGFGSLCYSIDINGKEKHFYLDPNLPIYIDNEEFRNLKHIFAGLIINKIEPIKEFITYDDIVEAYKESYYPKTPKAKQVGLFLELCKLQNYDGESVKIHKQSTNCIFIYSLYFKSREEYNFYCNSLVQENLIEGTFHNTEKYLTEYNVTFKGLNYFIQLKENGLSSNKCFIAMSYNIDMTETRGIIKSVCKENSYDPILVDEVVYENSQTINDAIIANLKQCKFCIADFTKQKDGVYFESGFALGQGKQVIFCCHENDIEQLHFDTKQFPHIVYSSLSDFQTKLDYKIKAWIK